MSNMTRMCVAEHKWTAAMVFCIHTGRKNSCRFYMEALYFKKLISIYFRSVNAAPPIAWMRCEPLTFVFLAVWRWRNGSVIFPVVFTYASLFGGIKLVMMYSACSLRLEIAAGYSWATPCRRLLNSLTVFTLSESDMQPLFTGPLNFMQPWTRRQQHKPCHKIKSQQTLRS